ncbi:bifunctional riboflavin kinase/FAD synthetase [Aquisediminimonas profunda]|uniref:bifunctional riboflavin kinase/FAD synthetase n=1 Tax=Aquisediminimonas profunda TaxID=1550733 RepID=UPI001C6327FE|nr:bifunctional riboflavin kinase/FAD synthetase [Aquisediminimonas profunda]
MERLDGSSGVPDRMRGGIVALGNFDGFHKGHQAVVGRAIERARAAGRPALVATFDPHPVRFFRPEAEPFRLTSLNQRQRLFAEAGADAMIVFPFNAALANLTADEFVTQRLAGVGGVVTGEDFTFGKGRGGNVSVLGELGRKYGFIAEAVAPVSDSVDVISSSRIREALQAGDCAAATQLLTRPFAVEGIVQHGDKNGRQLGYPTANVDMGTYLRPRYGIYAVRGRLADGAVLDGAASIGIRPQFEPPKELLEPHFFEFSGDLYGQTIEIEFHAFLRDEAKFETLEALTRQIGLDCDQAREALAKL